MKCMLIYSRITKLTEGDSMLICTSAKVLTVLRCMCLDMI